MASSLKFLLAKSRRQITNLPSLHLSPYAYLSRSYSEKPDQPPRPEPVSIQPVSYSLKPKQEEDPSPPTEENARTQSSNFNDDRQSVRERRYDNTTWTREDARYVKDVQQNINPVEYQKRVAPLPEDREGGVQNEGGELQDEARRMAVDYNQSRRAFARVFQEEEKVPFPTLIKVEKNKPREILDLSEAIRQVKANAKRNFEETVEAHVNLGVDRRRTDLSVSGMVTLPHGTGKVVKVAVFAEGSAADEAKAAGAYLVGGVELIEQILNGAKIDFDTCITTASFMPRIQKVGKILGKKGLMPNPKKGTVVSDITRAVKEAQRGRVTFKMDKTSNVHVGLGKVTFTEENLRENIGAFVNALLLAKPAGLKKTSKYAGYVNSFHICSTMGPGYSVSIQSISKAADHISRQQVK